MTTVSAFTTMARAEFAKGKLFADQKPKLADASLFSTIVPSTTRVENHTFLSALPRLQKWKGYTELAKLISKQYTIANDEYRIGIEVKKTDLDDDQTGMHLQYIQSMPNQAKRDVQGKILDHLAAGKTTACFDGSYLIADSHNIGTGDNLITANNAGNDGVTHRIIAMIVDNPVIKPVIFQDREPLTALQDDASSPDAQFRKEYKYWIDGRFGLGYGYWWDVVNVDITDTPSPAECYDIVEDIIQQFRTFKGQKGADTDGDLYIHEGWKPDPTNFVLVSSLNLEPILSRALKLTQYTTSTGNVDNVYKDVATVIASSALGA